jgi:hypothetical protein
MNTFIYDYIERLDEQWNEVDILLDEAKKVQHINVELYHVLCRSASILMVAHFEGFTKDLCKNVISDLNHNCNYENIPTPIKMTGCKKYLGFDKKAIPDYDSKLRDMMEDLSKANNYSICYTAFLFEKNKNPKPDVLKEVLSRFGIEDVFKNLHESGFEGAFISKSSLERLLKRMRTIVKRSVEKFPYLCSDVKLKRFKLKPCKYSGRTIWQTFLDDVNQNRHAIAHGNTFSNDNEHPGLVVKMNKIRLIQYIIIYLSCYSAVNTK